MPRGFIGQHAVRYLTMAADAHGNAIRAGNQTTQHLYARVNAVPASSLANQQTHVARLSSSSGLVMAQHNPEAASRRQLALSAAPRETRLPFTPEDALTGSFTTGRGNSGNIVVSEQEYEAICRRVTKTDEQLGECIYKITQEIETMCQTFFVLPTAVPRCMSVSNEVKQCLGQFRAVTDDMVIQTRRFTQAIMSIGG